MPERQDQEGRGAVWVLGLLITLVGLSWLALASGCAGPPEASPNNVVLITVDTLRADHVGVYGGPVPTPAMDSLAHEGVWVEGAVSPTPSTGPAHASMMTGLYPWNHGVLLNSVPLGNEDRPVLAEILQGRGYATGAFVSSFNVDQRWGFGRGFERFFFEPTGSRKPGEEPFWSRGAATTDAALDWLNSVDEQPFFLWLHYFDPHGPYRPPAGFERPQDEPVDLAHKSLEGKKRRRLLRETILAYRGEVAYTDHQIARILERLRSRSLLDDSLVVLTADHGEGLGDHDLLGHGKNLHDELVAVPLILRGPGLPAGERRSGNAQLEDLVPSVLGLLGLSPETLERLSDLDGIDLSPWLSGGMASSPRRVAVGRRAALHEMDALFFGRDWPLKWIGKLDGVGQSFALDQDPKELEGLGVETIPLALQEALKSAHEGGRERILDEESEDALRALGYL